MLSLLEHLMLYGVRLLHSHPPDGGVGIREIHDPLLCSLPYGKQFQRPYEGGALHNVGLLDVVYVG